MLTHLDDFLNHQIPQSFDHVASPHRNWTEKMWFSTEDTESGEILGNARGQSRAPVPRQRQFARELYGFEPGPFEPPMFPRY